MKSWKKASSERDLRKLIELNIKLEIHSFLGLNVKKIIKINRDQLEKVINFLSQDYITDSLSYEMIQNQRLNQLQIKISDKKAYELLVILNGIAE